MRRMWIQSVISISFVMMCVFPTRAQHFAFIESESQQPFFVKYNGGVMSSTPSGFLMLSGIMESAIEIVIGFPGAGTPQTQFSITGLDRDRGFYLKKGESGGWILMDRNDMSMLRGSKVEPPVNSQSQPITSPANANKPKDVVAVKDVSRNEQKAVTKKTSPPSAPPSVSPSIRSLLPLISYLNLVENDSYLSRMYIERPNRGKTDTVIIEIDKRAMHPKRNRPNN